MQRSDPKKGSKSAQKLLEKLPPGPKAAPKALEIGFGFRELSNDRGYKEVDGGSKCACALENG